MRSLSRREVLIVSVGKKYARSVNTEHFLASGSLIRDKTFSLLLRTCLRCWLLKILQFVIIIYTIKKISKWGREAKKDSIAFMSVSSHLEARLVSCLLCIDSHFVATLSRLRLSRLLHKCAGMAQWWEHSLPTNLARVRFPAPATHVVFSGYSGFPSPQKPAFDLIGVNS